MVENDKEGATNNSLFTDKAQLSGVGGIAFAQGAYPVIIGIGTVFCAGHHDQPPVIIDRIARQGLTASEENGLVGRVTWIFIRDEVAYFYLLTA